jgi:hypothetical protein
MDKSSAFVWKSARRQVNGLPDCPVDLTEPEYANLLFYARCHVRADPADGYNCSEPFRRTVENARRLFSGEYVVGIVRIAESDGRIPCMFQYRLRVHKQLRLCTLSSCHEVICSNNVLATEHIQITIEDGMLPR